MIKYTKGIKIFKLSILATDKDSFEECDQEILKELNRHPEINSKDREQIVKEVLCG